jgi:hypothetical protein
MAPQRLQTFNQAINLANQAIKLTPLATGGEIHTFGLAVYENSIRMYW